MAINPNYRKKIEKIINGLQCPKGFKCYKSGFKKVCKAKDIGMEEHLKCLEKSNPRCIFAIPFGDGYFCRCPLRVYIAKEIKKKY